MADFESPHDDQEYLGPTGRGDEGGRTSKMKARRLYWFASLITIAAVSVGAAVWISAGKDSSHPRSVSTWSVPPAPADKLPDRAVLDQSGLVRTLPNVARAIAPAITNDIRSGKVFTGDDTDKRPGDGQTYIWVSFNPNFGRYLRLSVSRSVDREAAHADFLARRKNMADQRTSAGKYAVERGPARALEGVGDEAYIVSEKEWAAVEPDRDNSNNTYDFGGSYVCVRFRNVVVSANFQGADYTFGAAKDGVMKGRNLEEAATRQYSIKLIQMVKGHLY
jgi:hypothetical protein